MKVIVHGCGGRMGRMLIELIDSDGEAELVAGIDPGVAGTEHSFPVFSSLAKCNLEADVVIDFSGAEALPGLINAMDGKQMALVVATTGFDETVMQRLKALSEKMPVFQAANMSLGINLMKKLVAQAASALGERFDIELIEKHHRMKKDAPSGTAFTLADAVNKARGGQLEYTHGREETAKRREQNELGIHAVRGGTIVGEHEMIFAGTDEVISISHSAYSRQVFAAGALKAARFLMSKQNGFFSMDDLLKDL